MGDLTPLETALGTVSDTNFAATQIDEKIEYVCDTIEAADWVKDAIRAEKPRLHSLVTINPSDFTSSIQHFSAAALMLGTASSSPGIENAPGDIPADKVAEHVALAKQVVQGGGSSNSPGWTGRAATAFADDFAKLYVDGGQAVESQRWMFNAMQMLAEAHQGVYVRTREDVTALMDQLKGAADKMDGVFSSPSGSLKFLITVVAAVATVSLTALNPPAGISLGVPLLAASASQTALVIGASPDAAPAKGSININSPAAVSTSFSDAISKLETEQQQRLEKIQSVLSSLAGTLTATGTREILDGPEINHGNIPVHYDGNGNAVVDDGYLGRFNPPPH